MRTARTSARACTLIFSALSLKNRSSASVQRLAIPTTLQRDVEKRRILGTRSRPVKWKLKCEGSGGCFPRKGATMRHPAKTAFLLLALALACAAAAPGADRTLGAYGTIVSLDGRS